MSYHIYVLSGKETFPEYQETLYLNTYDSYCSPRFEISDNHNDYDNDKMNPECENLLMVIYDNFFWCQVSILTTKITIRYHTKNGA